MIIPTKHEDLSTNALLIGADIISILKKNQLDIDSLFHQLKKTKSISLEKYYDTVLFLWLSEALELDGFFLRLKRE